MTEELNAALLPIDVRRIVYVCPKCDKQMAVAATIMTDPVQYQHECCDQTWVTPYYSGQILHLDTEQKDDSTNSSAPDDA